MPQPNDNDIANLGMGLPSFERMGDDLRSFETAEGTTRFEMKSRYLSIRGPAAMDLSAAIGRHFPFLATRVNPS